MISDPRKRAVKFGRRLHLRVILLLIAAVVVVVSVAYARMAKPETNRWPCGLPTT